MCRQLPSALLCEKAGGAWTYESEVSSPSNQTYQLYVRLVGAVRMCAAQRPWE